MLLELLDIWVARQLFMASVHLNLGLLPDYGNDYAIRLSRICGSNRVYGGRMVPALFLPKSLCVSTATSHINDQAIIIFGHMRWNIVFFFQHSEL